MKRIKIISILVAMVLSYSTFAQPWTINPADYEFTMNVTGQVKISGLITNQDNAYIGAFVNDECRGYVKPIESDGSYTNYFLTIYSNTSSGENISFKWVDNQGQEFSIENTMKFYTDSIICSADYPFIFMDQENYTSTDFLSFSVDSQITSASINANTRIINVLVSQNTDLTTIIPTFTLAPAAAAYVDNVLQESEVTQNDFSSSKIYTVKGIDGTDANWTVNIKLDNNNVNELISNNSFSIYPNPAKNILYIEIDNNQINTNVFVYNIYGEVVLSKQTTQNKLLNIDTSLIHEGVYFIKIGNITKKFVKK